MAAHSRNRLNHCAIVGPIGIEDVTRYQHMSGAMLTGEPAERVDGVETGLVQRGTHIRFESTKRLAQLPVS